MLFTATFPLFFLLILISYYIKKEQMTTSSTITGLSVESLNHGCTDLPVDPKFETILPYDLKYIEHTVYNLAEQDDSSLGRSVKQALHVIEKAYKEFG
jgi:hypothetical protein